MSNQFDSVSITKKQMFTITHAVDIALYFAAVLA